MMIPGFRLLSWGAQRLRKQFESRAIILMYHRIAEAGSDPWSLSVTPGHFAEQLEVLQKYGRPMRLGELTQSQRTGRVPHRGVVITFDDGYADNLYNAKPLLERYDVPATIFLTTGHVGYPREFWWDDLDRLLLQPGRLPERLCLSISGRTCEWQLGEAAYYSEADYRRQRGQRAEDGPVGSRQFLYYSVWQLLQPLPEEEQRRVLDNLAAWAGAGLEARQTHRSVSPEEACKLGQGGLIEIGAHTVTHPYLSAHSIAYQQAEIGQSKADLEKLLGRPVTSFSYPYGDYASETVGLVREAGFACACTTEADSVWRQSDRFQLPRFEVWDWDGDEFSKQLSRWFRK